MSDPERQTFYAEAIFSADARTHEHLHSVQGITDELAAWLESLNATVHAIVVRPAQDTKEEQ